MPLWKHSNAIYCHDIPLYYHLKYYGSEHWNNWLHLSTFRMTFLLTLLFLHLEKAYRTYSRPPLHTQNSKDHLIQIFLAILMRKISFGVCHLFLYQIAPEEMRRLYQYSVFQLIHCTLSCFTLMSYCTNIIMWWMPNRLWFLHICWRRIILFISNNVEMEEMVINNLFM